MSSEQAKKYHSVNFLTYGVLNNDHNTWDSWGLIPTTRPSIATPEVIKSNSDADMVDGEIDTSDVLSETLPPFGDHWVTGSTNSYYATKTSDTVPTFPFAYSKTAPAAYNSVPVYVMECLPNTEYTITPPTRLKAIVSEYANLEDINDRANALARWTDSDSAFGVPVTKKTESTAKYLVIGFSNYNGTVSTVSVNSDTPISFKRGGVLSHFPLLGKITGSFSFLVNNPGTKAYAYGTRYSGWMQSTRMHIYYYLHNRRVRIILDDDPTKYYKGRTKVKFTTGKNFSTVTIDYTIDDYYKPT